MMDGRPADGFMASPSFIGVRVSGGDHQVVAEYRSDTLKKSLLAAGIVALLLVLLLHRRFALSDARVCQWAAKLEGWGRRSRDWDAAQMGAAARRRR